MEKSTSVLGALDAQKLPSQAQTNAWIDWIVHQIDKLNAQAPGSSQLSSHGKKVATDVKGLLLAYKELGDHKNGDDKLQDAIWNLSQGQVNTKTEGPNAAKDEAATDAQQFSFALQNMLLIVWGHFTSYSDGSELASLTRSILADTAEVVERQAGSAKVQLRETEEQVQQGKRDSMGRDRTENDDTQDPQRRFETGMDTAKRTGSQAIGAGQSAKQGFDEIGEKTSRTIGDVLDNVLERAQNDEAYRDSVTTMFDLACKWFDKSIDAADKKSIDDVIDDPSGHIPAALSSLNTLLERLAGGKSSREFTQAFKTAAIDVREDPELHEFFDESNRFVRRTLHEPKYARSEEHGRERAHIKERWQQLQSEDSQKKWRDDLDKLRSEARDYLQRIEEDRDVQKLQEAYKILGKDIAEAAATLNEAAMGNANWIWQDVVDVVLPRVLESIKNLPIPRTEFKDANIEFVVEDLSISSLRLLPGSAHIRNTTDMDVSKSSPTAEASKTVKSQTNIHLKGVQFAAKDVSFWYHDQSMKPISEVSGLMGITVPEQGVDVDITLGFIPQTDRKSRDSCQHAFFKIDRVKVELNNPQFSLSKTNHPVLFATFKPVVRNRLEHSIETSLEQQITTAIQFLDGIAYDVHSRAGVFSDTGMAPSAAYTSAVWSEIGHLKSLPGPFSGLQTTSVGFVRDDSRSDAKFAMGTEPQIISGDKHGPEVPGSNASEQRQQAAHVAKQSKNRGNEAKGQAGESVGNGASSFAAEVKAKKEHEQGVEGWKSAAFDTPH